MYAKEVKELLDAAPFIPFSMYMANGKKLRIDHPELTMLSSGERFLVIGLPDDAVALADLRLATHIETHPAPQRTRRR
jgi:hypothetical protein